MSINQLKINRSDDVGGDGLGVGGGVLGGTDVDGVDDSGIGVAGGNGADVGVSSLDGGVWAPDGMSRLDGDVCAPDGMSRIHSSDRRNAVSNKVGSDLVEALSNRVFAEVLFIIGPEISGFGDEFHDLIEPIVKDVVRQELGGYGGSREVVTAEKIKPDFVQKAVSKVAM